MQPSGRVVFGISLILCLTGVGISLHVANVKWSSGGLSCSSQCTFQNYANSKNDIRYHCWVLLQVLFFCSIVQEYLNTIFLLFYWLFYFWCSSSWVNIFNNILVNTSVGNTRSCDPLWKHFIISYMNVVCVPIKSYKLEEFGEITLLYNSVMYYNIVTLPMHLCFLSSWITGTGIYLASTWSFLLAFEQRFLFKDMWVVFPRKETNSDLPSEGYISCHS